MIKGQSLTTDQPDIEHMFISGEEVDGSGDFITCTLKREDLTAEEQSVYDDAAGCFGSNYFNEIDNTPSALEINRVTATVLTEGTETIDYDTLPTDEKDKLDALVALIVEKKD